MNWADEPATETQLSHLRQMGCTPDHPLTKREAGRLISWLQEHPEETPGRARPREEPAAYRLRLLVEHARRAEAATGSASEQLARAVAHRQEFWLDTCREVQQMRDHSAHVLSLYQRFGCRFCEPTRNVVQGILEALDSAMPFWDIEQPEVFYQTLELNFPEMVRRFAC